MISPINLNVKAGISPVPKPPQVFKGAQEAVDAAVDTAQKTKGAISNFISDKAAPFIKTVKEKVQAFTPKAKEFFQKAVKWAKDLNLPQKVKDFFNSVKNSPVVKKVTEQATKLFKQVK